MRYGNLCDRFKVRSRLLKREEYSIAYRFNLKSEHNFRYFTEKIHLPFRDSFESQEMPQSIVNFVLIAALQPEIRLL